MAYGKFKSVSEVARKFNIEVRDGAFVERKSFQISELSYADIQDRLGARINFINEFTICEAILRPILEIVAAEYDRLDIWSHVPYNVDADNGLIGEPDYLIAPWTKYGDMERPVLCIIEAKQEKFDEGWAQALAEMVASFSLGAEVCYSAVTTGKAWEFGKLEGGVFTRHPIQISATSDLQQVFDILNWLFHQANIGYLQP